jgi:hypothetical protein
MTLGIIITAYGPAFKVDVDLCRAVGTDKANAAMRKAGRAVWSDDDYDLACDTLDRLCENAAGCYAEGKFMWAINERLAANA